MLTTRSPLAQVDLRGRARERALVAWYAQRDTPTPYQRPQVVPRRQVGPAAVAAQAVAAAWNGVRRSSGSWSSAAPHGNVLTQPTLGGGVSMLRRHRVRQMLGLPKSVLSQGVSRAGTETAIAPPMVEASGRGSVSLSTVVETPVLESNVLQAESNHPHAEVVSQTSALAPSGLSGMLHLETTPRDAATG